MAGRRDPYWVRGCRECGGVDEDVAVKDPKPKDDPAWCNLCHKVTEGMWLPGGDPSKDSRLTVHDGAPGDPLVGITLRRVAYVRPRESWDHDHCELCNAPFMTPDDTPDGYAHGGKPAQHEGYTNEATPGVDDRYVWICDECFEDFRARFDWRLA